MSLDPGIARFIDVINASEALGPDSDVTRARERFRAICLRGAPDPPLPLAAVESAEVDGAAGPLPARLYRAPEPSGATVVFFHGGGWVIGDLDTHDDTCRRLCRGTGATVLSVAYRLAPEHPFPAAVEDALAATRWAAEHVAELGGEAGRLAVAGDSAGGNLAAVTAQAARTAGPALAAQLLLYPGVDQVGPHDSIEANGTGYLLTREAMRWLQAQYLPDRAQRGDVRASPLRADDLAGVAPAVVATAGYDPLRDEGDAYAERLASSGVDVAHLRFDGLIHGFAGFVRISPAADAALERCWSALRARL